MASKVSKEVRRFNTNRLADIFSLLFTPFTVTRFAMHRKTNLLATSTRSSVYCTNLILGFSVNFVHKKHFAGCYQ